MNNIDVLRLEVETEADVDAPVSTPLQNGEPEGYLASVPYSSVSTPTSKGEMWEWPFTPGEFWGGWLYVDSQDASLPPESIHLSFWSDSLGEVAVAGVVSGTTRHGLDGGYYVPVTAKSAAPAAAHFGWTPWNQTGAGVEGYTIDGDRTVIAPLETERDGWTATGGGFMPTPVGTLPVVNNLVSNTSAETDLSGWVAEGGSLSQSSAQANTGSLSFLVTADGTGTARLATDPAARIPVPGGDTVHLRAAVAVPFNAQVAFTVEEYDAAGTLLTTSTVGESVADGAFRILRAPLTLRQNTASIRLAVGTTTNLPALQSLYVDSIAVLDQDAPYFGEDTADDDLFAYTPTATGWQRTRVAFPFVVTDASAMSLVKTYPIEALGGGETGYRFRWIDVAGDADSVQVEYLAGSTVLATVGSGVRVLVPANCDAVRITCDWTTGLTVGDIRSFPLTITAFNGDALANLVDNHSGQYGGAGWASPITGTSVSGEIYNGEQYLVFDCAGNSGNELFYADRVLATPGDYLAFGWSTPNDGGVSTNASFEVEFLDSSLTVIGSAPGPAIVADGQRAVSIPHLIPVGTVFARLTLQAGTAPAGPVRVREVTLSTSVSTTDLTGLPFVEGRFYTDILGPTHALKVTREALNVGTLSATVLDADLDPQKSSQIQVGKRVRLMALNDTTAAYEPIFSGEITHADVTYVGGTRIVLEASDAARAVAAKNAPQGVVAIDDLGVALEGCGALFALNGKGRHDDNPALSAYNENASALDQVAITRDTALGFAWVDRFNVLQVWDAALISATPAATLDEATYSDFESGFNTDSCINDVRIKLQQYVAATEDQPEGTETTLFAYTDDDSIRQFGRHTAEYTINYRPDYATVGPAILAANGVPVVRVNSLTLPIRRPSDVTTARALLDLYDLVTVQNTESAINDASRITGISHEITPTKWSTTLTFEADGAVASPQVTPAPPTVVPKPPAPVEDPWHEPGVDGMPNWQNGWSQSPGEPFVFRKDLNGNVWCRGRATPGTDATVAFTFPAGYRPTATYRLNTLGSSGFGLVAVIIDPTGELTINMDGAVGSVVNVAFNFSTF